MARVLVVDDEEDVRGAITRRLGREGYEADAAASAAEAISAISAARPPFDVVVSDMSMEEADSGLRVLREAIAADLFTEVVVLTAYGSVTNAVQSLKLGAYDYVEKNMPGIDVYELLVLKVSEALDRRKVALRTLRRMETFGAGRSSDR